MPKKLIEVSLPLESVNQQASREKSIRHGHPSTLHLWWARRPLAAARAVLWASLVDDPGSHPELFPTEEAVYKERQRLHELLARLSRWEAINDEALLGEARAEIRKCMGDEPLRFLDPFAGGGSIPLEAQRLGLSPIAHDLNPVACLINKAMLEIPPRFAGLAPVNPESRQKARSALQPKAWPGAAGLASDVRHYGKLLKKLAFQKIGQLYPKVKLADGKEAAVIAWVWARSVACPNPACACEMPLAASFALSKKPGKEAHVEPIIDYAANKISYEVKYGKGEPKELKAGRGANFYCAKCHSLADGDYIKQEGMAGRMGSVLMAIVAEGDKGRIYLSPDQEQIAASCVKKPENFPTGKLADDTRSIFTPLYGFDTFDKLFTPRQLTALTTFSGLLPEIQAIAEKDALQAGLADDGIPLNKGGKGAFAYSQAIAVYLAFLIDKLSDFHSSFTTWQNIGDKIAHTFSRQAIPMIWDYAEGNPFSDSSGSLSNMLEWICRALENLPATPQGQVSQQNACENLAIKNLVISTDPPYYDNIGYADLSDYFYVWLRPQLKNIYPEICATMQTPKSEELVATPYRFNGSKQKAKEFFEAGLRETFKKLYTSARADVPLTLYYAFKQRDSDKPNEMGSSGWETILQALIDSGFAITGTWPMRTERLARSVAINANSLASSIVLVCRKREPDAKAVMRRDFFNELTDTLPEALAKLRQGGISPVDLAQAAIGPGMAAFSRHAKVLYPDGAAMKVSEALAIIGMALDSFLSEGHASLDDASRFCLELYSQIGFAPIRFGEADVLARAKNTSVEKLAGMGLVFAEKGMVRLVGRNELPKKPKASVLHDSPWLLCLYLTAALEFGRGNAEAAELALVYPECQGAVELAWRLYEIAEAKGWTAEALAWNALAESWKSIQALMLEKKCANMRMGELEIKEEG